MAGGATTPITLASDFLAQIDDITGYIEDSKRDVSRIKNRPWYKNLVSSTSDDLVTLSKSQNRINDMMIAMIQEVIKLNTMSYSFLAAMIYELEVRARNGWKDSEGRIQELSETGKEFADKASTIFRSILEGSKKTQERIDFNASMIDQVRGELKANMERIESNKEEIDANKASIDRNREQITDIHEQLAERGERLDGIDRLIDKKAKTDTEQSEMISALTSELRENDKLDAERDQGLQELKKSLEALESKFEHMENWSGDYFRRTRIGLVVLGLTSFILACALVYSYVR